MLAFGDLEVWRSLALAAMLSVTCAAAESLSGIVIEAHSRSYLASVAIDIECATAGDKRASVGTDADGRFRVPDLPAGDCLLEASKSNYAPLRVRVRLGAGETPVLLPLVRLGVIAGRVSDAKGAIIPGAMVKAIPKRANGLLIPSGQSAPVDESGRFRIHGLYPGQYALALIYGSAVGGSRDTGPPSAVGSGVRIFPDNQQPRWFTVTGGEEYGNIDFVIAPAGLFTISGYVRTRKEAAVVTLTAADNPLIPVSTHELGAKGEFRFEGLAPGTYDVHAISRDLHFGRVQVSIMSQDVTDLMIPLEPGRAVSFVLGGDSSVRTGCRGGADLTLTPVAGNGLLASRSLRVDFGDPQAIGDLAPVPYVLSTRVRSPGCYAPEAAVDLRTADLTVTIPVSRSASIIGNVTGAPRPAEFGVLLIPRATALQETPIRLAYPDDEARFVLNDLPPGEYSICSRRLPGSQIIAEVGAVKCFDIELLPGVATEVSIPASLGDRTAAQ